MQSMIALGRDLEKTLMAELLKDGGCQSDRNEDDGKTTERQVTAEFQKIIRWQNCRKAVVNCRAEKHFV